MSKCWRALVVVSLLVVVMASGTRAQERPAPDRAPDPEIEKRVDAILARMTLEQKIDYIGGVDRFFVREIPEAGLPRLEMADGPLGVRNGGPATAMAGGVALAASWNPALAGRVAAEIARDARAKGVHFMLGPAVNIYRAPMNGRNFEYFGEDPFLASRIAVGYVRGMQAQGVSATIKHFAANNSEFDRHNTDSLIDERTLREIYLPAFEAAVKEANVGAIMSSYNLVNGVHASQNGFLQVDVARKDWGFTGVIMSDWDATYDGLAAAKGGLDLEMPSGKMMNRETLLPAIQGGQLSVATIDEKVKRILRTAIRFGWLDREQKDLAVPRYNQQGRAVALEAAREGIVLLKNEGGLLPLDRNKLKKVAVIGPAAYPAVPVGGGSARVEPFAATSLLQGISDRLGTAASVSYARGLPTLDELAGATSFTITPGGERGLKVEVFPNLDLSGAPAATRTDRNLNLWPGAGGGPGGPRHPGSARWTGYFDAPTAGSYDVFVQSGGGRGGHRLLVDDALVVDCWQEARAFVSPRTLELTAGAHKVVLEMARQWGVGWTRIRVGINQHGTLVDPAAKALAAQADVVVAALGFDDESESESADRTFALPVGQDDLVRELVAANKNTIVTLTAGGNVDMSAWLASVPALVHTWYPGQEGGSAVADVLFGDVDPSGRLPVTFERRFEDNPTHDSYYPVPPAGSRPRAEVSRLEDPADPASRRVEYKEGVFVGYRGYERSGVAPLFPFGFGLSYTSFAYGKLAVGPARSRDGDVSVSFDVTNTGSREGKDVAQVYVSEVKPKLPRPGKELKGFAKVSLRPGETQRVTLRLDPRSFAYFDVKRGAWRADAGRFEILVGRSSAEIVLRGALDLAATLTIPR
jgi:beta-glucosidase